MALSILSNSCTIRPPFLKVGVMRKPIAMLRMLALLAIALGVYFVIQDARQDLPFWWSQRATTARFTSRVEQLAHDPHKVLRELRDVPAHDSRGMSVLVDLLGHSDAMIRDNSLQVINENLDDWRLAMQATGGSRIVQLLKLLESRTTRQPELYRFASRNLVERVQQLCLISDSHEATQSLELCEQIAKAIQPASLRTADRMDAFGTGNATSFEDEFALPGGGL